MGAGNVGVLFYGVRLADNQADVVYGLIERSGSVKLPDDTPPEHGRDMVGKPWEPINGRHWVGIRLMNLPPLPPVMRSRVLGATEPQTVDFVELPRVSPEMLGRAAKAWDHFAAWCARRGVTLPGADMLVAADYD